MSVSGCTSCQFGGIEALQTHDRAYQTQLNQGAATARLEAQLARYQKQLSDCVNCDSSKTAEGKAQIEAISAKISALKERIDKVGEANTDNRSSELATSTSEGTDVTRANPGSVDGVDKPAAVSKSRTALVGTVVDVQA